MWRHATSSVRFRQLRELDDEHLICDNPKPNPGGSGAQILTALEPLDRIAVVVPPPRFHCHVYFGAWRKRPLMEKFCGHPERQQLADSAN